MISSMQSRPNINNDGVAFGPVKISFSGNRVNILNFTEKDVILSDITRGLLHKCRFDGHLESFYSVLWHSIHVREIIARLLVHDQYAHITPVDRIRLRVAALLHDSPEAFGPDYCAPDKPYIKIDTGDGIIPIRELEQRIATVIYRVHGIEDLLDHPLIKFADRSACAWEMENVCVNRVPPVEYPPAPSFKWANYSSDWARVEQLYLQLLRDDLDEVRVSTAFSSTRSHRGSHRNPSCPMFG